MHYHSGKGTCISIRVAALAARGPAVSTIPCTGYSLSRRPRHRIRLSSPSRLCQRTTHCRACPPLPALGRQPGDPAPGASGAAAAWPDPSSMVRPIRPSMASMMALSAVRHLRDETAFFLEDSFLPSGFGFWPVRHCLRTRRNRSGVFRQIPFDRLSPRNGEVPRLNVGGFCMQQGCSSVRGSIADAGPGP